jgi:hypothetical protein
VLQVLDQRFDGGEPGARGQQDDGFMRIFVQEETALRAFEAQDVALLHGGKHLLGKQAAWHVADVQLERLVQRRCIGDTVRAALAVAQQKFDVLAGAVSQRLVGWQLQRHDGHIARHLGERGHARWHLAHRVVAAAAHFAHGDVQA